MTKQTEQDENITRFFNDPSLVTKTIEGAIRDAIMKHKKLGNPICVSRNGKVVWIEPKDINTKSE